MHIQQTWNSLRNKGDESSKSLVMQSVAAYLPMIVIYINQTLELKVAQFYPKLPIKEPKKFLRTKRDLYNSTKGAQYLG